MAELQLQLVALGAAYLVHCSNVLVSSLRDYFQEDNFVIDLKPKLGDINNKIVVMLKDKQVFILVVSFPHAKLVYLITSNSIHGQI